MCYTLTVKMAIRNKRNLNEKKFPFHKQLPDRGRMYWLEVKGRHGWKARYVKEVDANEKTVKFYQEVYDQKDNLVEIHKKFPVDKGHRKLRED